MNIDVPLDGKARDQTQVVSKALMGNKYMLEALAIIDDYSGDMFQAELARLLGCASNQAGQVLSRLVDAGMVEATGVPEGPSRQYHRQLESRLWPVIKELLAEVLAR